MYCVKCGVKLQEGVNVCPLCGTPVWNPEGINKENRYSDNMPKSSIETKLPLAIFLTVLCIVCCIVLLVICLNIYGNTAWSGYPIFGLCLFYVMFVIPLWFRKPNPVIFWPINFTAISFYLFYINAKVGGHWFFTFALPIVILIAIDVITVITLARYVHHGGLFIAGGSVIYLGAASLLIELFQTITFHTKMFTWSLYTFSAFFGLGIFLIIAGIYKPLKNFLQQYFFF